MKNAITVTGTVTLAPTYAHSIMHPHDTEQTYTVYEIDGQQYIQLRADTRPGRLLTLISDTYTDPADGLLKAHHAPIRVNNEDMPIIYTGKR